MEFKYASWIALSVAVSINLFGVFWVTTMVIGLVLFLLGFLTILYLQHSDLDKFLDSGLLENPLDEPKSLGLSIVGNVSIGEEVSVASAPLSSFKSYLTHPEVLLHRHETPPGSPKKKKILSGNKPIDQLIHTILDYVVRDFIDSWYTVVSDNREFSECNIRTSIESLILQICNRVRSVDLLPLMTTRLIDDLAKHTRFYRLATQEVTNSANSKSSSTTNATPTGLDQQKRLKMHEKLSPQRRTLKVEGHRRNKSETDLTWQLGQAALQKNVANSRFYNVPVDEQSLGDPETMLLNAFFGFCEEYRSECLEPDALNEYFRRVSETVLYFVLPEEDFNCLALRTLLCNLLANSLLKPAFSTLAEPDFINLQIAKQFTKEPPAGEFLLKMIRQSTDLSELRACRQLITKEMDAKYKDSSCSAELASLKYTQKLIDLRISHLQNNKNDFGKTERDKASTSLPQLTLDDILRKELAVFYYLDYLSVLNLQKYVIFYLTAQEWKISTSQCYSEMQTNKSKLSREELLRSIRDKASNLYQEYLQPSSPNYLNIDPGLIEALNFRLNDPTIQPENTWFDSICKYIYEKQKNEEVFLNNFYQSVAYKQLLRELDFHNAHDPDMPSLDHLTVLGGLSAHSDSASDTNSGDIRFDETDDDEDGAATGTQPATATTTLPPPITVDIKEEHDVRAGTSAAKKPSPASLFPTTVNTIKHARSHSDCTGMFAAINDLNIEQLRQSSDCSSNDSGNEATAVLSAPRRIPAPHLTDVSSVHEANHHQQQGHLHHHHHHHHLHHHQYKHKLSARIINTAIHCEGHYAVYAIQVHVIEDNHHKSWHIYRRYSKFLELKKLLVKRFPALDRVPFPAKKAFQNTQRAVLEHRMEILNRFLAEICAKAELSEEMMAIIRNFLEPDTDDRKMHGGPVVKTIESLKSGMSKIRNMPDTLVGGISRMFVGKSALKERSFYDIQDIPTLELKQSEYPALASALNLLDEVFDLQNKSQWLRRGLINRLLGAPWVSHATNKRIVQGASSLLAPDKLEAILSSILNNVWPEGDRFNPTTPLREDSTRLRTKLAAKISLFALLSDDLKHVVGSVTCNSGLLNFFQMLQNKKLNTRLLLILFNRLLVVILQTESVTKHAQLLLNTTGGAGGTTTNGTDEGATIRVGATSGLMSGARKPSRYS
ncbi:sorting nexin-13 isoform X4 [Anopheles gambiae]|uniref:sorting nexin-13-like isoform X4 n=1 Tax=Anopheles coluzzii TaxID=1518534 RepID=UPI0020FF9603|nr:sorting nexin-13-like isoform X4 [Anopheles coluzzii]XP_061508025.1 sorting nexin-13 isoform X4 [Anopheles gambiae]